MQMETERYTLRNARHLAADYMIRTIREGDTVERTGTVVSVPVGDALVGRVVNALGHPVDGKGPMETQETRPIERNAPGNSLGSESTSEQLQLWTDRQSPLVMSLQKGR